MVVEVERSFDVAAPVEDVWEILSDPSARARAISVVENFEQRDDETVWHVEIPIPMVRKTVAVRTYNVQRDPPNYVRFQGDSKVMSVTGEHELTATDEGCRVHNRFVVDGKVPGVETFFERNFDGEIGNILRSVENSLGLDVQ